MCTGLRRIIPSRIETLEILKNKFTLLREFSLHYRQSSDRANCESANSNLAQVGFG